MPTSFYQMIPHIMSMIETERPTSVLDVGVGFGKYGVMVREVLEVPYERYHPQQWRIRLDGIEVFAGYRNPIHEYVYNQVWYGDISDLVHGLPSYDVILLIDVLEHFTKDQGLKVLNELLAHTKRALIVSTPIAPEPQGEYLGNVFETHRSRWSVVDFVDFDCVHVCVELGGGNGAHLFKLYPRRNTAVCSSSATVGTVDRTEGRSDRRLKFAYVLPHQNLTGGLKSLLVQMRHLRERGHAVSAVYRGVSGGRALPEWADVSVDHEVVISPDEPFVPYVGDADVVVAGWCQQLPELSAARVPLVYWEQGHEWLFGDVPHERMRDSLWTWYQTPCALASVSTFVARAIKARFGREAVIVPNGVDTMRYTPPLRGREPNTVLLVGNPALAFKGFTVALRALVRAWSHGHRFRVVWVCQTQPYVHGLPFQIEYVVSPPEKRLIELYQTATLLLFSSWYEGFGMPPLEAMACGLPVVMTHCGGADMYARDGLNALMADPGDDVSLSQGVTRLLTDESLRELLSMNGRQTALAFSMEHSIEEFERFCQQCV